jgi:hypothetical protein
MHGKVILFSLIVMYVLFSISCKKNEDSIKPVINASTPAPNTQYNTFDSIFVQAEITDEEGLTFISVELLNSDLISVVAPYGRTISGNSYSLFATLVIDNIHLQSGKHYVMITAKDSKNTTRHYIEVFVYGLPLQTNGYVCFENTGSDFQVRSLFGESDTLLYQGAGNIKGGIVDSYHQQFGFLKGPDGPFEAYPLFPFIDSWEIPVSQGGLTFCRMQANTLDIQIGFKNQLLSFYQGEKNLSKTFTSADMYYPELSLILEDDIITWQKTASNSANRIETFFNSGALKQVTSYNRDIVQLLPKSEDFSYILSNTGDSSFFDIYGLESGVIQSEGFATNHFYDGCIDSGNFVYIATESEILRYNPQTFQFSTFASVACRQIAWDYVNNVLVAGTENEVLVYSPTGSELQNYPLIGDCVELSVWYTK